MSCLSNKANNFYFKVIKYCSLIKTNKKTCKSAYIRKQGTHLFIFWFSLKDFLWMKFDWSLGYYWLCIMSLLLKNLFSFTNTPIIISYLPLGLCYLFFPHQLNIIYTLHMSNDYAWAEGMKTMQHKQELLNDKTNMAWGYNKTLFCQLIWAWK